jgi:outer membrane immunogenic protein
MRMIAACAVAVVSATVGASPAFAQDEVDFQGFRIEGFLGWDNSGTNFQDDSFQDGRTSQDGLFYGVGLGYDFNLGGAVLGIEAELSDSTAGKNEDLAGTVGGLPFTVDSEVDAAGDIYVGARAGAIIAPQLLLYAKGGYTHFKIDFEGDGTLNGVPFAYSQNVKLDGFRIGAGAEYALSRNFFTKFEYRYSNYNSGDLDIGSFNTDLDEVFNRIDVDRHQVIFGAGFRF